MRIKQLSIEDIDELHQLGCSEKDFSADGDQNRFWPKDTLKKLIESDLDITLKLTINDSLVGFALVMIHPNTQKAVIENFFVQQDYQEHAKVFLKAVEEAIRKTPAQFIAYFFDETDDTNGKDLFTENEYFVGNSHLWLHKNISFSNPKP